VPIDLGAIRNWVQQTEDTDKWGAGNKHQKDGINGGMNGQVDALQESSLNDEGKTLLLSVFVDTAFAIPDDSV
jgi:hypothetical protein